MDDFRDELKEAYKYLILNSASETETFRTSCLRFLDGHGVEDCFKLLPLNDIRRDFLKIPTKKGVAEFEHFVKVFQQFEKYAASILAKPWCKDMYTIKVYTGFFKYNFEQWLSLDIVYEVFKLIGYKETSPDTLTLQTPVDEDRVLVMGFELYLAHTQLYVLKRNEDLSSKYSLKSIVEGWLNTTGNAVNILEWLVKNKSTTKMESGFKERTPSSTSSTDIPEETTRSKSVTVEVEPSYYDKNGHSIYNHSVKYPPNCNMGENKEIFNLKTENQGWQNGQHDYSANSGFTSLRTADVPDYQLYGDSDHAVSPPPNSGSNSDYLDKTALDSMPLAYSNKLHEHLQNEYGDNIQMATDAMRRRASSEKHVVARGGNSERDSSHLYENTTTVEDILAEKERVDQILATRVAIGEKSCKQNLLNRNSAPSIIQDDYTHGATSMLKDFHTEVDGEGVKYVDDFERKRTDGKQLGPGPSFSDAANNFQGMDLRPSCDFCGNPPDYGCRKCEEIACKECFASIFHKRPCHENEHDFYYFSVV